MQRTDAYGHKVTKEAEGIYLLTWQYDHRPHWAADWETKFLSRKTSWKDANRWAERWNIPMPDIMVQAKKKRRRA